MRHVLICCLTLLYSCKKEHGAKVQIYMIKLFTANISPNSNLPVLSISNAVLADTSLIADQDIAFLPHQQPSKGSSGLVCSFTVGVATIVPILYRNTELEIEF